MTRQGRAYTPKETVSFERTVASIAAQRFDQPMEGPVRVTVYATFEPAKSWSKKKTAEHINRHHTQKPDGDNIIKAILDGMNRIAFADDSQVAEQYVRKMWGPKAQTVIFVEALAPSEIEGGVRA
jgi:Holliday junction resolvase RusA-like endonuclease